jgi:hypothetical protein
VKTILVRDNMDPVRADVDSLNIYNIKSAKKPEGVICFHFTSHTVAGRLLHMTDIGMITLHESSTVLSNHSLLGNILDFVWRT